jgi:hypothetical protein
MPELVDPRPIDPPEEDWPETQSECIVDGSWGIYVPQRFCERYKKIDSVSQDDWDICLFGPEHELYWEAWDEILNDWTFEETDSNGGVWKIYISQDGDLFQCREFVRAEGRDDID